MRPANFFIAALDRSLLFAYNAVTYVAYSQKWSMRLPLTQTPSPFFKRISHLQSGKGDSLYEMKYTHGLSYLKILYRQYNLEIKINEEADTFKVYIPYIR